MQFEEFRERLAEELGLPGSELGEERLLSEDLGLDSLDLFRVATLAEDLSGVRYLNEPFPDMFTVGELYKYYDTLSARVEQGLL
jgi:acyl carrier protein